MNRQMLNEDWWVQAFQEQSKKILDIDIVNELNRRLN